MNTPQFKYSGHLESIPDCPPTDYAEIEINAFRFVHDDAKHPDNFTPVKLLQPNRYFTNEKAACMALELSMFIDKEKAKGFYEERVKKFPRFAKNVGNHIATLKVGMEDGVASKAEELNFGHFTFHEYLWCDFYQKILTSEPV